MSLFDFDFGNNFFDDFLIIAIEIHTREVRPRALPADERYIIYCVNGVVPDIDVLRCNRAVDIAVGKKGAVSRG